MTPPTPPGTRLLETPYCTITWDSERSLVRFVRSALPYAGRADIVREGDEIERTLDRIGRGRLLVDLRAVVARDDEAFEQAITVLRRKLLRGPGLTVILVRTAVGALQVKRHVREDGFPVEVRSREDEALALFDDGPLGASYCVHGGWTSGPFRLG